MPGLVCRLHHPSGLLIEDREWSYPGRLAEPTGTLPGCYRTGGDEGRCISGALFAVLHANSSAVGQLPVVVEFNVLSDMGRKTGYRLTDVESCSSRAIGPVPGPAPISAPELPPFGPMASRPEHS